MSRHKLTVIIPCFNEHRTILEIVGRVRRLPIDKSIIVVDNCSTDGTREILIALVRHDGLLPSSSDNIFRTDDITLVLQPRNHRKGTSIKMGIALANSDYVICQDADLEYDAADIPRLLEHAEKTRAVAVFGSRLLGAARQRRDSFALGRAALGKLFRLLYRSAVTDVATCYKLLRTDLARSLDMRATGFDLDFEIAAKLVRNDCQIAELPISYDPRSRAAGKKIRWRDGFGALWAMLRNRWSAPHGGPAAS